MGCYAYLLIDPRNGQIFYVGKGVRRRLAAHAKMVRAGKVDNTEKFRRIAAIQAQGREPLAVVFAGGMSDRDALRVEKELIKALRGQGLTNISGGNCTNAERLEETVAAFKRNWMPSWLWRRVATPQQIAAVERMGGPEAMRDRLFAEMDEALALVTAAK